MKLIVGLGNPSPKYEKTRHNVGFMVVDYLKNSRTRKLQNIRTFKSDRFMNDSGLFVKELDSKFRIPHSDLYVIHDDLDIKLGEYKIQFAKGPKDHNGVLSIEKELKTKDFWRVRIGVDNRDPESGMRKSGEEYVLEDFTDSEMVILNKVIHNICKKLETL